MAGIADSFIYVIDSHNEGMFIWAKKYLFDFLEQHKEMRYYSPYPGRKRYVYCSINVI